MNLGARIGLGVLIASALWIAGVGAASATYLPLVDKTIQVIGYGIHQAPDHPGEFTCFVFVGFRGLEGSNADNVVARVNLADQAFDELIGTQCGSEGLQNTKTNQVTAVENARVFVGGRIAIVSDRVFGDDLARGVFDRWFHADYRRIDGAVGIAFDLDAQGHAPPQFGDAEFKRVSQPDIPVEPSHREPNLTAVVTEIAPGVSIGLENKWTITFSGDNAPTLCVQYRTDVPITDLAASEALASQVAQFFGKDMLARGEARAVRVGAYNEPRRSRFHFRPFYDYAVDRNGKKLWGVSDLVKSKGFGAVPK